MPLNQGLLIGASLFYSEYSSVGVYLGIAIVVTEGLITTGEPWHWMIWPRYVHAGHCAYPDLCVYDNNNICIYKYG